MQQALFREAEFSVFRNDLPARYWHCSVTLPATQILHVTETSNVDALVTQNIIDVSYPSCILFAMKMPGSDPGNFGLMLPLSLYTEKAGATEQ